MIPELIHQLEAAIRDGRAWWGGRRVIDEEAFYVATTKIRRSLPATALRSLVALDALEKVVEESEGRFFGKVVVKESACHDKIVEVARCCVAEQALIAASPTATDATDQAEFIIAEAQAQAAQIIAQAHQEAESIRQQTR